MMSILHFWKQGAHTKSLSTKKQAVMPEESAGYIDLADAQLEAASGGYGQWGQWNQWAQWGQDQEQSYRQHHSKGHHGSDHQYNSGSNPNWGSSSPSTWQSFKGHW